VPVVVALPLMVMVEAPGAPDTVVPAPNGVTPRVAKGSVTAWPLAIEAGVAEPVAASTMAMGEPLTVSTVTSRFGPRLDS
jgi:hypothetical protein